MEQRLIDANVLKETILKKRGLSWESMQNIFCITGKELDNAPTVEPEKAKEGELVKAYTKGFDAGVETVRSQGEWIPASERLPDDMQRVLIWFEYYRYGDFNCMYQTHGFGYVCDGKWSPFINGETGWQDYNIIAWQPLPEPYEKGGTE